MKIVRIALVGAGYLGTIHAQKFAHIRGAKLTAVVDSDVEKAKMLAEKHGGEVYQDCSEINLKDIDAAIVVTTTSHHYDVAKYFLSNGVHCFIEKPITTTLEQADELIEIARKSDCLIQVGHVERFNSAVTALSGLVSEPRFIECDRIAPYQLRATDVSVILDLMIHDIDLVSALFGSEVVDVQASGSAIFSPYIDVANARLTFANGGVANVTASRAGLKRERVMRIFQRDSYTVLNLLEKSYTVHRKAGVNSQTGLPEVSSTTEVFDACDAIMAEQDAFVRSIVDGDPVVVTGKDGRRALSIALQIKQKVKESYAYSDGRFSSTLC